MYFAVVKDMSAVEVMNVERLGDIWDEAIYIILNIAR